MTTFVALADSITQGIGDPVGGAWRGWAVLLAEGLRDPSLHVLSRPAAPAALMSSAISWPGRWR